MEFWCFCQCSIYLIVDVTRWKLLKADFNSSFPIWILRLVVCFYVAGESTSSSSPDRKQSSLMLALLLNLAD